MSELLAKLSAPFDPKRISWRVGSTTGDKSKGMALAYIDSRDVQDRLDAVCGADGWQCRYPHAGQKTVCEIGIRIGNEWIWKADGAGDTDVEQEKGALSDAFKRAAVKWGIGRYLYDCESPWVQIEQRGKSYVIAASEIPKLQRCLPGNNSTPAQSAPAAPKSAPGISAAKTWVREHMRDLNGSEDGEHFMNQITTARTHWIRICAVYPNVWEGAEFSGLHWEARKLATIYQCQQDFDAFVKEVTTAAEEIKQPPMAAE